MIKIKLCTLFILLFSSIFANAGFKNLYKQDFETCGTPQNAGWSSPNLAGNMKIASTENGSWFEFSLGNNNNRNAVLDFNYGQADGATIYGDQSMKQYTVKFQWGIQANTSSPSNPKNAQFSTEVAVIAPSIFTSEQVPEGWKITGSINNFQYAGNDSLRLFTITQLKGAYSEADGVSTNPYWEDGNDNSNYILDYYFNGDTENKVTLEEGMWYDIAVTVDTEKRTASYVMTTLTGEAVANGTYNIPEVCGVWAKGINVLLGRYNAIAAIDEVKVQVETEGDYANAPSLSLVEIDQEKRTYDIYFEEGEILNVKTTEGTEDTATDSPYRYVTTTSGTLDAWTTSGTAESEHVTQEVDASVIALPEAVVDITKVNNGYVKTYKLTVDNSTVPTQPNILITYKYNGEGPADEFPSGTSVDVTEKGTLEVTTVAYGFAPTTITIENNIEFAIDQTIDFQHMDAAKLTELGFTKMNPLQDSKMSGELNWTARERLWYGIADGGTDDAGNPTYEKHVVWGPAVTEGAEAINRMLLVPSLVKKDMFAPLYTWQSEAGDGSDAVAMKFIMGIGMIQTGILGDAQDAKITVPNVTMGVDGLTENDYYIVYAINNYGSSSLHPLFPQGTAVADATAAYKAMNLGNALDPTNLTPTDTDVRLLRGTETFDLYRIDTAISRIEIFKAKEEESKTKSFYKDGILYSGNKNTNTAEVMSADKSLKDVSIPSLVTYNGTTYSVTSIGKDAFHHGSAITSVAIPSTVTSIGERAFGACTSLTSVSIPNSVTEIAPAAFYGCSALRNVTLPSGLKKVDDNLFWGCTSLTSVTIPESVTIIGEEAFRECLALPSITIPNSITEIGDRAFEDCSSLKEVISEIQKPFAISDNVFAGIASKATLTVPRGTKSAYQNTTGWKFASITDGTTEIQTKRTIHVATAGTLPQLISEYEKYQIEELTLTGHINGTDLGFLREMAGKATSYREDTYLGSHLFDWDVINNTEGKLKVLDLSGVNITSGGAYLTIYEEYDISTTKYYYVQSNEIPEGVFGGCRSLTSITLPNSVTSIGDKAFIECFGLTSINIPNSVTFIASNAFSETAWYGNQPDGLVYAGKVAYKYKGEMSEKTNITIKDGTYGVTGYAFVDCKNLASVNIPNSVSTIGSHAFYNCKGLTSITIPNSVTSIGSGAFRGCSGMNTVVSEIEKPFEIDSYVFEGIPSDAELIVPNGTKATYQTTKGWNIFTKIKETSGNDEPEIVLTALSYTREYGEANPVFEYTVEGDGQNGTPTIISDATSTSPVGTYPIKISKGSITNDNVTFVDGTLTITKAPLTITAKNYSREQGQANPNFEVTYSGFKNGETEAMLTKRPTVTTMATSSSSPGTYDIEVSGAEAQNYSFIYNKGMLIVTEKDEVAFTVDAITYQGTKSAKSVVVKTVDAGQNCFEIPAFVSNDGTTYQVTGVADGAFNGCIMAALIWNVEAALPNNAFSNSSIGSNFLLYVKAAAYAPSSIKNVIANGTASSIVLSDDGGQFYCPQTFTARSISYTHNYSMETGTGKAKGWESIALPFDVQKITHSTRGEIVPFPAYSSGSNQKPFWLGNMSVSGFKRASSIQAYEPYIIAMPNNSKYNNDYNLAGDVTFSAENVQITNTPSFSGTFLPAFATVTKSPTVYALNVNNRYVKYSGNDDPGSCFISNLRDIRPFEAYLTGNFTRSVIEIGFDDDTTDMLDVLLSTDEAQEMTIYTLSGLQVTRTTQRDFDAVWRELPKGVYIVNGKKLIK